MNQREDAIKWGVVLAVTTFLAVVLAWKPISDVDLGWHLAGGLLIQAGLTLDGPDSLGSTGHLWWNYSWLFQLLVAQLFRVGGFAALCVLQGVCVLSSVLLFICFAKQRAEVLGGTASSQSAAPVVVALALLPFLAPMWHLRPQLLSMCFFILLLSPQVRLIPRLVLTVLWANVHVFWLFSPLIVAVQVLDRPKQWRFLLGSALLLFFCGAITPFGLETYVGLYRYAYVHQTAYSLIKEFQPFSRDMGLLFWYGIILLGIIGQRITVHWRRLPPGSVILSAIYIVAAAMQIKYLPYAAISSLPILLTVRSPGTKAVRYRSSDLSSVVIVCLTALGTGVLLSFISPTLAIDAWRAETLRVASDVSAKLCHEGERGRDARHAATDDTNPSLTDNYILTNFNDGGWFALGFALHCPVGRRIRTVIDGRTLVMGESRLGEYHDLVLLRPGWEQLLSSWNINTVALPDSMPLARSLLKSHERFGFDILDSLPHWVVLYRKYNLATESRSAPKTSH